MQIRDASPAPPLRGTSEVIGAEGFFAEIFNSLTTGAFLTGLARLVGAGPLALAFLVALPFFAQVGQVLAPYWVRRTPSYKRLVRRASGVGRGLWLVAAALPWLVGPGPHAVWALLLCVSVMAGVCMVGSHGWTAWMADCVPATHQCQVFGRRMYAVTCGTLAATVGGALLVDAARGGRWHVVCVSALGAVAVLGGWAAVVVQGRLPDVAPTVGAHGDLRGFVAGLRTRPEFVRVLVFFAWWGFSVGVPAPFWSLCMLEHLHMSFVMVCCHDALVLGVRLLCNRFWITTVERWGAQRVLTVCSMLIVINPLLWLFASPQHLTMVWVEAAWTGIVWTGFSQAAFIVPIAALSPADRSDGLALFNVVSGASQFVAAVAGGVILQAMGATAAGYAVLFVVSSLCRLGAACYGARVDTRLFARTRHFFLRSS